MTLSTLSSLFMGLIYMNLFYKTHMDSTTTSLLSYARKLSTTYTPSQGQEVVETYDALIDARIWIFSGTNPPFISTGNHRHRKPSKANGCHMTSGCKVKGYDNIFMDSIWRGEEVISKANQSFYYGSTLSVGVPIVDRGTVVGAILIHAPLNTVYAPILKAAFYLIIGLLVSNLLIYILARKYAFDFTSSIRRMKEVSLKMMDGDYTARTNITREDEIGDLSHALDTLAFKLDEASKESTKLEQLRKDFVANVSHEFRTPLTVIKGHAEALSEGISSNVQDTSGYILKETLLLERLVTELLDLSRLEQQKLELTLEELSLQEVIQDALRNVRQLATAKNIRITTHVEHYPYPITSDYLRLRQVFIILLDNALKYTLPEGTVTLSLAVLEDTLKVTLQDTGIGIAPEDLPFIWDRFYKSDKARKLSNSSGLGLAIAKHLFELLHIHYELTSTEGLGTTITLSFKR